MRWGSTACLGARSLKPGAACCISRGCRPQAGCFGVFGVAHRWQNCLRYFAVAAIASGQQPRHRPAGVHIFNYIVHLQDIPQVINHLRLRGPLLTSSENRVVFQSGRTRPGHRDEGEKRGQ
ncbi:hypothetical protein Micbo1qcDRAFT_171962 [Microdochium bolleyi]|uniref:Uncharacterized protein n=1 Tax=Microdochium bolleyi TaxID=196109 RepID=A0A136JEQ1_9PEZI|nr:hypothetical protein Micbo1qcDRAFT_171962 [Microdochium bolleyi]